jgi:hypothetical protein
MALMQASTDQGNDAHRLSQRAKQLEISKNSLAYWRLVYRTANARARGRRLTCHDVAEAQVDVASRHREPEPQRSQSKRGWEGTLRMWRAELYKHAPIQCREGGYRAVESIYRDGRELDLYEVAQSHGLDIAFRSCWTGAPPCGAVPHDRSPLRLWVPPSAREDVTGDDILREYHSRSGEGSLPASLHQLSWWGVERHWSVRWDGAERPIPRDEDRHMALGRRSVVEDAPSSLERGES